MKPIVLLDPAPRTTDEIFSDERLAHLRENYHVIERGDRAVDVFYAEQLATASFIVGQPPMTTAEIERAKKLKAIINVEGNFLQNMDYDACFRSRIHVLTISPVFAQPVAELALGLTLALARDIPAAHQAVVDGRERYGLAGNTDARLVRRATLGFVGFGDLGRAILKVFQGFDCDVLIHDPWLSPDALRREGLTPVSLERVLSDSDIVQVVAAVTEESTRLIGDTEFAMMKPGALFLLLSRADVVDIDALMAACRSGHLRAALDVFPEEPLASDHPLRTTPNLLLSAHRAGALTSALSEIGERVVADIDLMAAGLPPQNCKRAERELVSRSRSKPVSRS